MALVDGETAMSFVLGSEGDAAAKAITALCDKAAACIDVPEVRGLVATANQVAINCENATGKVVAWLSALEGAFKK